MTTYLLMDPKTRKYFQYDTVKQLTIGQTFSIGQSFYAVIQIGLDYI